MPSPTLIPNPQPLLLRMKTKTNSKPFFPVLASIFVLHVVLSANAAVFQSTGTGGAWATAGTWTNTTVPAVTDTVIIATTGAGAVTNAVGIGQTGAGSVTVNSGATLYYDTAGSTTNSAVTNNGTMYVRRPLLVTGNTVISGTINFGSSSALVRAMVFTGPVTLNSGAVWNAGGTNNNTFSFTNNFVNNATTFTPGSNTYTFAGANMTLSGNTTTVITNAVFSGTYTNLGTLTVVSNLTGSGQLVNGGTGVLNLEVASVALTALTATSIGNTVNYDLAGAQTVEPINYQNLILSGSGTKTMTGVTNVGGNLSLSNTAAATFSSLTNISGNFTNADTAAPTLGANLTIGGNVTMLGGTLNLGTGLTHTFAGTFTRTAGTVNLSSSTLNINGSTSGNGGTWTPGTSTVNYGGAAQTAFAVNYNNLILSGSAAKTMTGVTNVGGYLSLSNTVTATLSSLTNISGNFTNADTAAPTLGANLTVGGSVTMLGGTLDLGSGLTHTFTGTFTRTAGTVNLSSSTLNINGTTSGTGGTWTPGTSTVNYGGAAQTAFAVNYNNLILSGSNTKTTTGVTNVGGDLTLSGSATAALAALTNVTGNLTLSGTAGATNGVNLAIGGNLVVGNGTTFGAAGFNLAVTGATTVGAGTSGTLNITSSSGTKSFGDVTVNNGATWNNLGNSAVGISGNLTNSSTFTAGSGLYTLSGTGDNIAGTISIPSLTVTGTYANWGALTVATALAVTSPGVLTNNGTITATTALSGTGELAQNANSTLNIGGTSAITTLTAQAGGNTVNYTGAAQTAHQNDYVNLTLSGSGAKTMTGVTNVGGYLSLSNTVTATFTSLTNITGNFTNANTASPTLGANLVIGGSVNMLGGGTLDLGTGLTHTFNGTFTRTAGTVNLNSSTLNINGTTSGTGGTWTPGTSTVNYGGAAQTAFGVNYYNLILSGSAAKTMTGVTNVGGYLSLSNAVTATLANLTNVAGNLTIADTAAPTLGAGLTVGGSVTMLGGTLDLGAGLTHTFTGTFTRTAGTVNLNSSRLNINGSTSGNGGTWTPGTSTVNYGGAAQTAFVVNYNNLILSGSAAKTMTAVTNVGGYLILSNTVTATLTSLTNISGNFTNADTAAPTLGANLTVGGNVTMLGGTLDLGAGLTHTFTGIFTRTAGTVNLSSSALNINGTTSGTGGTWTPGTSTVNYGGAAQTVFAVNYNNLILSGSNTKTMTGVTNVGGDMTLSASAVATLSSLTNITGNLALSDTASATNGANLVIGGNLVVGDGTTLGAAGFNLTVAGATTIGAGYSGSLYLTSTSGAKSFADVTVNSGATWNNAINEDVTFSGSLTNSGTFTAGSGIYTITGTGKNLAGTLSISNLTVSGTCTNNGSLTVATALAGSGGLTQGATATLTLGGTSTITALTATASGNTVNYTGAAQTVHNNDYYNLTLSGSGTDVLQIGTTTVGGNFTASGTVSVTLVANLSVAGDLNFSPTSGTLDLGTFTANRNSAGGTFTLGSGATLLVGDTANFPANYSTVSLGSTSTVNYGKAGDQTVSAQNYGHLTLSGSGNKTLQAATAVAGNLTLSGTVATTTVDTLGIGGNLVVGNGTTFNAAGFALTVTGTTTVGGGTSGILNITSATGTKIFAGLVTINTGASWNNSGNSPVTFRGGITTTSAFSGGSGVHTFDTATAQTLTGTFTIPSVTVNSPTSLTNTSSLTVSTALEGTGTLVNAATGTLNLGGTAGISALTATAVGNTVNYAGTGQTLKVTTYHHLTLSGGPETFGAITTVNGNLTLSGSATATNAANLAIGGNLVVGNGTTFGADAFSLAVSGTTTVGAGSGGILNIISASGAKSFVDVIVNTGGTWSNVGNSAIGISGNLTNSGSFTAGNGTYTLSGSGKNLAGSLSIPSLTVSGTYNNNGSLTVNTALAGGGGLTQAANATLNLGGTSAITSLTAAATGNTVNFTGTSQTVNSINYYHLTFSGSGAAALQSGTATISGNLSIGDGLTLTVANALTVSGTTSVGGGASGGLTISSATGTKIFTGLVTVNGGATWNNSGNSAVTFWGGITSTPGFTGGSGVHTFDINTQTLTGTFTIPSVTVTGVTLTNSGTLTVDTALIGNGGLTQGASATLNLGGTSTITTLTASATGNTVNYTGASQTVNNNNYYHLTLSGSGTAVLQSSMTTISGNWTVGGTVSATLVASVSVAGDLTVSTSSGALDLSTFTANRATSGGILTLGSGATLKIGGAGSLPANYGNHSIDQASTIEYSGTTQTVAVPNTSQNYGNLTISGSGTKTLTNTVSVVGNLTASAGTLDLGSFTADRTSPGGTLAVANLVTLKIGGSGTLPARYSTHSIGATSTVEYSGSAQTVAALNSSQNYGHLTLSGTGIKTLPALATIAGNLSLSGAASATTVANLAISGQLAVGSGTAFTNAADYTLNVTGSPVVTGTLTLAGTGAKTFTGDVLINPGGNWIETGNAAFSFAGSLQNDGTLTDGGGTHTFTGTTKTFSGVNPISIANVTVNGTYVNNGTLTVATALAGSGTLTQGASDTLNLGGTATITTLTATAAGNIVNYNGAVQTVRPNNYQNLVLSTSGAKTMAGVTNVGASLIVSNSASATLSALTNVTGNVTLSDTASIATGTGLTVGGSLSVGNGTAFTNGAVSLTVTGTTTVGGGSSGILAFSSATDTKIFTGLVTIGAGATWDNSINSTVSFRGGITSTPTFIGGSGVHTFESNIQTLTGTFSIPSVTVTTISLTNTGALTVSTALAGNGTLVNAVNSTLNYGGISVAPTLTATAVGNTVNYTGTNQTLKVTTYHHLTLSGGPEVFGAIATVNSNLTLTGSATATNGANLTIGGSLGIGDGATFGAAGFSLTVTGTTTVGAGSSGILNITSATGTKIFTGLLTISANGTWNNTINSPVTFRGGITSTPTFMGGTGVHTFDTTASQTLTGTFSITNVTVTGAGVTLNNSGTLSVGTALSGTGGLTQGAGATLNVGGGSTITTLTATANGNTVNYYGGTQTAHQNNYQNLTLSGSGTKTLTGVTNVGADLTLSGAAVAPLVALTNVTGSVTLSGTAGATNGVALTIGADLVVGDNTTFGSAGFNLTVTGATTVGGGLSGTLNINSATGTKLFAGLVTINPGATWANTLGNSAVTFRGGITNSATGTFNAGSGVHTFDISSQALSGILAIPSVTVMSVTLTNNGTLTNSTALAGTGELLQGTNSSLIIGANAANLTIATLTATANPNTVHYNLAGAQTLKATTYQDVILSGSGIKTMNASTAVDGNLSIAPSGSATASIAAGLNLPVGSLTLGGNNVVSGTWGSITATSAANKNNTYFAATTGYLTVSASGGASATRLLVTLPNQTFSSGTGISGTPINETAGTAFNLTLRAVDALNGVDTNYSGSKTVSYTGPANAPDNTAPTYTTTVTFAAGVAASVATTLVDAETVAITPSIPGLTGVASSNLTVVAGAATKLAFTTQPGGGTGGTAWATQPAVTIRDQYNNPVTGTNQTVTLAIQNNAGPGGALTTTLTALVTTGTGVATFSGLKIDKAGTGYTLTATGNTVSTSAGVVVSDPFNITTGAASKLAYTTVPSTGTAGTPFSVTVQSQDAGGNPSSPTGNTVVTLSKATGAGTLSGTLTGTILTSSDNITISTPVYSAADTMTLTATRTSGGGALTAVTSGNIVFSPGAADATRSTISPGTATLVANGTSNQVITVRARDANSNNITGGGATVAFSLFGPGSITGTTDPGNGTYTATVTAPTTLGAGTVTATLGGTAVGTAAGASNSVISYTLGVTSLITANSNSTGTTLPMTVPASGVPVGNTVILTFAMDPTAGTVSATDTQGNTYTSDQDTTAGTGNSGVRTLVLSAHITKALVSGNTITITHPSVAARAASACYASGLVSAARVDQTSTGIGTNNSPVTASLTTRYQDEVLIGAIGVETNNAVFTLGNGYTALPTATATNLASSSIAIFPEYRITSTTNAYTAGATLGSSPRWSAALVAYRTPNISTPIAINTATSTTGGTTITNSVTGTGVPTNSTVIVCLAMDPTNSTVIVTDTAGNTYTADADVQNGVSGSATGVRTLIFSALVTNTLVAGNSIISTISPAVVSKMMSSSYFSGLAVAARDKVASATGASTSPSSGSTATTTQPDELLIGAVGVETTGTGSAFTAGSGYIALASANVNSATGLGIYPEYQITNAIGTYAGNGSLASSRTWAAAVVTYKMLGGVDPAHSTISEASSSITANGSSTDVITVQARDAYNNPINTGGEGVTLSLSSGTGTLGATTDNGDGTYKATLTAPTATGSGAVTATINGVAVGAPDSSVVTFTPGAVTAAQSTVSASPTSVLADGTATSTITVTLKDVNSNVVSGKTVTLAHTSGAGTPAITTTQGTTDASGVATFTVKSTTAAVDVFTATDTTDTITVTQTATVTFTAGAVTAAQSTVSASPSSVTADGTTTSTITVTLKDVNSNPVSGKTVTLAHTSGAGTPAITTTQGTTDASGVATFTVKSTTAAVDVFTATDTIDSDLQITQTATVTFTAGAVTAAQSTVSASPSSVTADGTTTSTITVTLKDVNSNVVSGKTVTLAHTSGAGTPAVSAASGASDGSGVVTFTVNSTTAAADVFTATDTTDSNLQITPTATVTFTAGAVTAAQSTVAASPTSVLADGTTTSTITVTLKDVNSNPVSGKTVTLAHTSGAGTPTISAASGASGGSGVVTFTVKSTTTAVDVFTATDTTDSNLQITQTATVTFTPGAIHHYVVSASSPQAARAAFSTAVTAEDINNNTVTTDSSTVVTMTSSGNAQFDSNGDSTFGDNTKQLSGGTFNISTKDSVVESVTITATDGDGKTGNTGSIIINPASGDFQTHAAGPGDWNNLATWDRWNGSSWTATPPTFTPTNGVGVVTVRSNHTVVVTASVPVDQVVVQFSGKVTVNNGVTVSLTNGPGTDLDVFGTLDLDGSAAIVGAGNFVMEPGSTLDTSDAGTFTVATTGNSTNTVEGVIADGSSTLALVKSGSAGSTLTLSGVNTYSGDTTISAGTLALSGSGSIVNSPNIILVSGATFDVSGLSAALVLGSGQTLKGNGTVVGELTVGSGATISPGLSIGSLTFLADTTLEGTANMEINKSGVTWTSDKIQVSSPGVTLTYGGTLAVTLVSGSDALSGGEVFDLFDATTLSGSFATTNLPSLSAGLNWYTNNLTVDGSIKVNRAPVGGTHSLGTAVNQPIVISAASLAALDSDPDGDTLTVTGVTDSPATSGGTFVLSGGSLTYTPPNSSYVGRDVFHYTTSDQHGGTATSTAKVNVRLGSSTSTLSNPIPLGGGQIKVVGFAIPGRIYKLQAQDNGVGDWVEVVTLGAVPASGVISYIDTPPVEVTSRNYRLALQ